MHGKEGFYRAPDRKHTTNIITHDIRFPVVMTLGGWLHNKGRGRLALSSEEILSNEPYGRCVYLISIQFVWFLVKKNPVDHDPSQASTGLTSSIWVIGWFEFIYQCCPAATYALPWWLKIYLLYIFIIIQTVFLILLAATNVLVMYVV